MRQIDEQFLESPFFGVRQMTWHLRNEGHLVNEKRIRRLMRLMGLLPIHCPAGYRVAMHERGPETRHEQGGVGARDLPLPAAWPSRVPTRSGLVRGHPLSADAPWLLATGRHHGLAHPQGAGVAYIKHIGSRLLPLPADLPCKSPAGQWSRRRTRRSTGSAHRRLWIRIRAASSHPLHGQTGYAPWRARLNGWQGPVP